MTKLPLEDRNVVGIEGPIYELNVVCPVRGCGITATDTHHIWRRSFLAGAYTWVTLPDGRLLGNLVKLCGQHHHMVTVNAAWITWMTSADGVDRFFWSDMLSEPLSLTWQPPLVAAELIPPPLPSGTERPGVDVLGDLDGEVDQPHEDHQTDDPQRVSPLGHDETLPGHTMDGTCPTCLRPLPHKKEKDEQRRERRTWSITVPKDEREDGAETLDNQLEEARQAMARAGLPYGDSSAVRFFVLSQALGLFVMHADDVLS